MKGICLAFLLDYFGHKCVCEFFSLSTSEQEEVVVVVVGGGGGVVGCLSTLHALQVSFATTGVGSLPACVCVFLFARCCCCFFFGGGGGWVPGLVG